MSKKKKLLALSILVLVLIAAAVCWALHEYRSVTILPLKTEAAEALKDDLPRQYQALEKVTVKYWFPNNLEICCYGSELDEDTVRAAAESIGQQISTAEFQDDYSARYSRRYKTDDSSMKSVMLYFYEDGALTPEYRFSATAPFDTWTMIE